MILAVGDVSFQRRCLEKFVEFRSEGRTIVLVTHDMLGMFTRFRPRFVRRYAELGRLIQSAVQSYAQDVRTGGFPGPDESY